MLKLAITSCLVSERRDISMDHPSFGCSGESGRLISDQVLTRKSQEVFDLNNPIHL